MFDIIARIAAVAVMIGATVLVFVVMYRDHKNFPELPEKGGDEMESQD